MSGILDNKSRILDAILTIEGRRQMAAGSFQVSYASFSDSDVAYLPDADDGHADVSSRVYLEATNLPQDQITFEADDSGRLIPFRAQDIRISTSDGNVSSSSAIGTIKDGRLVAYEYHHGRRIKVLNRIDESYGRDKGFVYSDTVGVTAKILTYPRSGFPTVFPSTTPGAYFINTLGGLSPNEFCLAISSSIAKLRDLGGPNVYADVSGGSVYLDGRESFKGTTLYHTGSGSPYSSLTASLLLEEGAIGGRLLTDEIEGSAFSSQIVGILTSSFDNFTKMQTLASVNPLFNDKEFSLSTNDITFNYKSLPITAKVAYPLISMDSLFSDNKMSHLDNFRYLPPIVKTSKSVASNKTDIDQLEPFLLASGTHSYPPWGDNSRKLTYQQLMAELSKYEEPQRIVFNSSVGNNLISQIFEVGAASSLSQIENSTTVKKLDVVDYGDVLDPTTGVKKRVFFVGKVFVDSRGTTVYVNMFTLIFTPVTAVRGFEE